MPSRCYPVLKGNPYLDEIIIYDEKDRHKGVFAKLKFISLLKRKKFDTVFLLHRSFSRAFICYLAGIPRRIGYNAKKRGFLLTQKIPVLKPDALHRIDYYLNIIEKAGIKVEDGYLDFFVGEEDTYFVNKILGKQGLGAGDFLVGINPGGNWLAKRWPAQYWAELADELISRLGAKVVITGSHSDLPLAVSIKKAMREEPFLACGIFNLKQSAALFKRLDLFISADSGPLHIANSVGAKKIIALFGPTSEEVTGPYPSKNVVILRKDIGCKVPCYVKECRDNRCMKAITPEEVMEEIKNLKNG